MAASVIQTLVSNPVDNADSDAQSFGTNPVAARAVIVVVEGWHSATAFDCPQGSITDNQGNTYQQVVQSAGANSATVSIHYCKSVASSGTFTITVNPTGTGNYFSWTAYEASGLDVIGTVRAFASTTGASTTVPTISSSNAPLTGDLAIIAVTTTTNQASIVVETVSPAWVESMEQLSNTHEPGEIDQRVLGAAGAVTGNWTFSNAGTYAAAIAIFAKAPPADTGVLTVATNGSQWAVAGVDVGPAALYDAASGTSGRTIIPYLGPTDYIWLTYYDHNAATFTAFGALFSSAAQDAHGVPSIIMDNAGKYHVFGGGHQSPLKHSKSDSAHDPTAWTQQGDVTTNGSYPNAWYFSDGTMVLFYRAGSHTANWVFRFSTDNGATWSSENIVITSTASNVWYLTAVQIGDFVHMMIVFKDETNVFGSSDPEFVQRYGVYYIKWDYLANLWKNAAGSTLTTPIAGTDLDGSCVVRAEDHANGNYDCEGSITVGADGYPAILNTRGKGTSHTADFSKWNGSAWSTMTIASTGIDYTDDSGLLVANGTNGWIAYIVRNGTEALVGDSDPSGQSADFGGNIDRYTSGDNGATWQRQGVVSNRFRLNFPSRVVNGISPIKYIAADWTGIGAGNGAIVGFTDADVVLAVTGPKPSGRKAIWWNG